MMKAIFDRLRSCLIIPCFMRPVSEEDLTEIIMNYAVFHRVIVDRELSQVITVVFNRTRHFWGALPLMMKPFGDSSTISWLFNPRLSCEAMLLIASTSLSSYTTPDEHLHHPHPLNSHVCWQNVFPSTGCEAARALVDNALLLRFRSSLLILILNVQ